MVVIFSKGEIYRKKLLSTGILPKCKICGTSYGYIDAHHIDGNHNNHEIDNLIFLCRKCHYNKAHTIIRDSKGKFLKQITNDLNL